MVTGTVAVSFALNPDINFECRQRQGILIVGRAEMGGATGWLAIALALFAGVVGIVPGAFSVLGLLILLASLIVSVFSVTQKGRKYFITTTTIAVVSVFLVNDALRIGESSAMPINMKLTLYGLFFIVVMMCTFFVARLAPVKKQR